MTPAPMTPAPNQPDDEQQHDGADGRVDDRSDNPCSKIHAELRQQPVTDESTDDPDNHVTEEPETRPFDEFPGQPPRGEANGYYDKETFTRHVHGDALRDDCSVLRRPSRAGCDWLVELAI
jgi:hypothetical protein